MTQIPINIYGIIPINPINDCDINEDKILLLSFMAVGVKIKNIPTRQNRISKKYGTIRNINENIEKKFLLSTFGLHA